MTNANMNDFYNTIDNMVAILDGFISDGSDQELFIASYLHGHFDLAVASTEKQSHTSNSEQLSALKTALNTQLEEAYSNQELIQSDQQQVNALVDKLFNSF